MNIEIANNHAIFLLYISESIPAGIFERPLETFKAEKIAPYATSDKPMETFNIGPITVSAPCPKCFIP